jgi:hypothetical protein
MQNSLCDKARQSSSGREAWQAGILFRPMQDEFFAGFLPEPVAECSQSTRLFPEPVQPLQGSGFPGR